MHSTKIMSRRDDFEKMIAERIELASSKTSLATRPGKVNDEQRKALEDCGLSIALALSCLADLKAASDARWAVAAREMEDVWWRMEATLRVVTGEPAVTLVRAPAMPTLAASLIN